MTKTGWLVLVIIIVVVAGGLLWWNTSSAPAVQQTPPETVQPQPPIDTTATSTATSTPAAAAPMSATVTYDGDSFSPAQVMIAKGGTVTFTDTAGKMWVASDEHPTHTEYDGTSRSAHCAASYTGAKPF